MKIFKNLITLFLFVFIVTPFGVEAATISLSPASVVVHEGETFNINVNVNAPATREYTVKMDAVFTTGIMRISTWTFGSQWTVLRQPGYDSFDNSIGSLIRTGGYPGGFTGSTRFGTATFVAGKPGKGTISLTNNSFIFNEVSQNTYAGANVVNIEVLPGAKKEPAALPPVAKKSFDIALVLDKPVFRPKEDLSALMHLTNLSSKIEPLEVPIRYKIFNANGGLMSEYDYGAVALDGRNNRFDFKTSVIELVPGMYSIVVEVDHDDLESPASSVAYFRIEALPTAEVELVRPKFFDADNIYLILVLLLGLLLGSLIARHRHHYYQVEVEEVSKKPKTKKNK